MPPRIPAAASSPSNGTSRLVPVSRACRRTGALPLAVFAAAAADATARCRFASVVLMARAALS